MRAPKALLTLPLIGVPVCANAQAPKIALDARRGAETSPAPIGDLQHDIVVNGRRYGEANVAAESEFNEDQIAAQGVDTIQDLLTRLAPFLGGDSPVILINGRPAGFDQSILSYPPEALAHLALLKPEAASRYGAPVGKRVVNLVLKPKFSSLTVEAGVDGATGGGQSGQSVSVSRVAISGDTRWNVQGRFSRDGELLQSARAIPRPAGLFDTIGFISNPNGGEIDPVLSVAAGEIVATAAIPPQARSGMPTVADFAATANTSHPTDPNAYDTLLPSRQTIALDAGVTRPLGALSVSLDINANSNRTRSLRGLPMVSAFIPSGSLWSPFAQDVLLTRPFDGGRALRSSNTGRSVGASLTLGGAPGGWQTSFALSYLRNWNDNILENGVDLARIQKLIDAGDPLFNPYGWWDRSFLLTTRSQSHGDTFSARFNIQKKITDLPAGPLFWSLVGDASRARTDSQQNDNSDTAPTRANLTFSQVNAQMALAVPLIRHARSGVGRLGEVSINFWAGGQAMTRTSPLARFGGGLNWSPISAVQFNGVIEYVETAPSFDMLDAPLTRAVNRIFDYTQQTVEEPIWITGGNPDLQRGTQQTFSLSAMVQPLRAQGLMLNLNYRQTIASHGSTGFPALTPMIEAAFPDLVTRDASGELIAVDARAINITRNTDTSLLSGIMFRLSGGSHRSNTASMLPAEPFQFTVAINDVWHLKNQMLIRPGVPVVDQLNGGTGMSRHSLNLQLGVGKRGMGANVNATWNSRAQIDEGVGNAALHIRQPMTFNLSVFLDPDQFFRRLKNAGSAKGLRLAMDVANVFNSYTRVTTGDGNVPIGFSHDQVEPLGRTLRLTVGKRF